MFLKNVEETEENSVKNQARNFATAIQVITIK